MSRRKPSRPLFTWVRATHTLIVERTYRRGV
jgi:hypothetical protein